MLLVPLIYETPFMNPLRVLFDYPNHSLNPDVKFLEEYHGASALKAENFQINLDVQHFNPKDIKVEVSPERLLIIECKHQEKKDEQGCISRHFIRKIFIPVEYDVNKATAKLTSDGLLIITAPRLKNLKARQISVTQTGKPAKEVKGVHLKNKL